MWIDNPWIVCQASGEGGASSIGCPVCAKAGDAESFLKDLIVGTMEGASVPLAGTPEPEHHQQTVSSQSILYCSGCRGNIYLFIGPACSSYVL